MRSLIAALALFLAAPAHAGSHMLDLDDVAQFEVLPGWRTQQGSHITALRVRLAPGWKTYWRAPGEAGIPPRFDWAGSENLGDVRYHWPSPDVFEQNGMRSIGYAQELVLPIELFPSVPDQKIEMRAALEIGVCQDVCVPVHVRLKADLNGPGASDARIRASLNARPDTAREAGVKSVSCSVEPISDGLRLTARMALSPVGPSEVAVFELPDQRIWVDEAQVERSGGTLTAVTEMVPPSGQPFVLDRSQVRITILSAGRSVEVLGCAG